jgi:hypothetical protein
VGNYCQSGFTKLLFAEKGDWIYIDLNEFILASVHPTSPIEQQP